MGAGLGFGLGWWCFRTDAGKSAPPDAGSLAVRGVHRQNGDNSAGDAGTGRRTHGTRLEERTGEVSKESIEIDPSIVASLTEATQPALDHRNILFSDGDLVARVLAMTADEKSSLEREWARIKDRILRQQHEHLRYEQGEDDLWIGADPFDGEAEQESFHEAVVEALGAARGDAFLRMTRADHAFGAWGRGPSAGYTIKLERQEGGGLQYRITERTSPDAPAGKSWISAQVPPHIREMKDALGIPPEAIER
ncbi:MAG: hypothetical protein K9M97_02340 [Akkermansiaceae bacterium]|nr:hypothetical protein [Akkermansiaceae bacterium]